MEVIVGPTFSIDVPSAQAAYVRDRSSSGSGGDEVGGGSCLFLKEEDSGENGNGSGFGVEDSSDSSSSIGGTGDSEVEEEEEEEDGDVSSKVENRLNGTLASLGSLEDSLPIKRGLSNHYSGKSKSFANLLDVSSVKDLEKAESPFNKRRRILMANKWSRRSSFYSWQNPKSMPLLALKENDHDHDQDQDDNPSTSSSEDKAKEQEEEEERPLPNLHHRKLKPTTFKSQSCFSLADLQQQHH